MSAYHIPALALAHVLPHVSTEESRPTLRHVFFRKDGVLMATDGATLALYRTTASVPPNELLHFPPAAVALVRKATRSKTALTVMLSERAAGSWTLSYMGTSVALAIFSSGPYPECTTVIPDTNAVTHGIKLNAELLQRFWVPTKRHGVRCFWQSATRAFTVLTDDENFFGVMMPMRMEDGTDAFAVPGWVRARRA